jgi:hypothetical protein
MFRQIHRVRRTLQCQDMMIPAEPPSVPASLGPLADQLRLAVAAYLARFKGLSREHTESDLRCYLAWGAGHGLDPLAVQRAHLELYIRWMQETRRFKPSTISRRFSVTAGFYRTCAIDGVLEHSPAIVRNARALVASGRTVLPCSDTFGHGCAVTGGSGRSPSFHLPPSGRSSGR